MSARKFIEDIVHGRSHPAVLLCVRVLLFPLSLLYALIVTIRNLLYDLYILKPRTLPVPVISVGNITVGGTGKTPVAMLLLEHFKKKGMKPALLARNYGAKQGLNDELSMIRERFPDIIIIPGSDRCASGLKAAEQGADIIILDDGFQHRQLKRDCDILTIDSRTAEGFHFLLPAGPFRELWSGRKRADILLYTKCESDSLSESKGNIFYSAHKPAALTGPGAEQKPEYIKGKSVFVFCGIGDPEYFTETVSGCGAEIKGHRFFPDHYLYTEKDADSIIQEAKACHADVILTTEKDMVKAAPLFKNSKNNIEFLALSITIEILGDVNLFWNAINESIAK